ADPNPYHTAAKTFVSFLAPVITWVFLSSVTSSYVAANTQTARVIFGGARGGLWSRYLGRVSPRFRTPGVAAVAFVAPSIAIAVGIVYMLILQVRRPDILRDAPGILEGAEAEPAQALAASAG